VAVALIAFAGVAIAAGGGGSKPVTICAQKGSGKVFLADKGKCGKRAKKLVVGKRGRVGAKGRPGAPGPAGSAGQPLEITQDPATPVAETVGDCPDNPGTFCGTPGATGTWSGTLTYRKDAAGWVRLTGGATASEGGSGVQFDSSHGAILFLPPGFRPTDGIHRLYISRSSCHNPGIIGYVDVLPNGAVKPNLNSGCVGLSKVVFHP